MTISDSIPSFRLPRPRRPSIRQIVPVALAVFAAASVSAVSDCEGSINVILALTAAITMIGGAYWLGRGMRPRNVVHDRY